MACHISPNRLSDDTEVATNHGGLNSTQFWLTAQGSTILTDPHIVPTPGYVRVGRAMIARIDPNADSTLTQHLTVLRLG